MPPNFRTSRDYKFARAVLTKNLQVKPGENVIIEGWPHTLPWAVALARETRRLKAFPLVLYQDDATFWDSVKSREDAILGAAPPHEWAALGKANVYIHMWNAPDRLRLESLGDRAGKLFAWNRAWYKTAQKAGVRGARLDVGRPFPSLAKVYGVNESKWVDQLLAATEVDPDQLEAIGAPIRRALERGRRLHVYDDNGTDLTLGLAHRKTLADYGRVTKEDQKLPFRLLTILPAGVVRVAVSEAVADGTFRANRSTYTDTSMATGGVLNFHNGRMVSYRFDTGSEIFDKPYRRGGRGRDKLGYVNIGLNPELHNTPQLEDREVGAVTVGIGNNAFLPGGKNRSKFGGTVTNVGVRVEIDGRPLSFR